MNISNTDGWFFDNPMKNEIHYISDAEIEQLLQLAVQDDIWAQNVRKEMLSDKQNPKKHTDWILEELRIKNTAGAVVPFPFGLRIITFPSRKHLFRGENQIFEKSIPSLNRKLQGKPEKDRVMWKALADLRIYQFLKFIWNINVVPYWEAKLSDINIKALAQHYGFDTHLLDLTNDVRVALFFATCKYVSEKDCYRPLTEDEVKEHPYGVIFHTPNWQIDYLNHCALFMDWSMKHLEEKRDMPYGLDNGDLDGFAFQIGYQPFMRCHHQSGYIMPMAIDAPLQNNWHFEKMYIRQSVELSERIFKMMDGGKKIFPNEGISEAKEILDAIKNAFVFSEDDIACVYEFEGIDKAAYPTLERFISALQSFDFDGRSVTIQKDEVEYPITPQLLDRINAQYDGKDLRKPIGGLINQKGEDKKYREQRCMKIYGKLI